MIEKNEKGHIRGLNFRFGNHVSINFLFQRQFRLSAFIRCLNALQKALRTFFQWVIFCVNLSGGTPIFLRQPPIFAAGEINKSETREEEEWMHQLVGKNLYHNNKSISKSVNRGKFFIWLFSSSTKGTRELQISIITNSLLKRGEEPT